MFQTLLLKDTCVLKSISMCQVGKKNLQIKELKQSHCNSNWQWSAHCCSCCSILELFNLACQNVHSWAAGWPYKGNNHVYNPHSASSAGNLQSWVFVIELFFLEYCVNSFLSSSHTEQRINSQKNICKEMYQPGHNHEHCTVRRQNGSYFRPFLLSAKLLQHI